MTDLKDDDRKPCVRPFVSDNVCWSSRAVGKFAEHFSAEARLKFTEAQLRKGAAVHGGKDRLAEAVYCLQEVVEGHNAAFLRSLFKDTHSVFEGTPNSSGRALLTAVPKALPAKVIKEAFNGALLSVDVAGTKVVNVHLPMKLEDRMEGTRLLAVDEAFLGAPLPSLRADLQTQSTSNPRIAAGDFNSFPQFNGLEQMHTLLARSGPGLLEPTAFMVSEPNGANVGKRRRVFETFEAYPFDTGFEADDGMPYHLDHIFADRETWPEGLPQPTCFVDYRPVDGGTRWASDHACLSMLIRIG